MKSESVWRRPGWTKYDEAREAKKETKRVKGGKTEENRMLGEFEGWNCGRKNEGMECIQPFD